MTRNLKLLGSVTVAALSLIAMFAGAAHAETEKGTFTAGETPKTHLQSEFVGNQITEKESENTLESFGEQTTCKSAIYTGTAATGEATEVGVAVAYTGCSAKGLTATVTMNGCSYTLKQPSTIAGDSLKRYTGLVDVVCPAGKKIEIHAYLSASETITVCTQTIPAQTAKSHIIFRNTASNGTTIPKDDIDAEATVTGLKVERDKGTCGEAAITEEGVLKTNVTIRAYKDNSETKTQTDLWISDPATP